MGKEVLTISGFTKVEQRGLLKAQQRLHPDSYGTHDILSEDIRELFLLQRERNRALGLSNDPKELLERSYNEVHDRWHVNRLRKAHDLKGLEAFRLELRNNMRTNLMERLHAVESYGEYTIRDGELYSVDFPEKPFGEILERGVRYREQLGSPEQEREGNSGELGGWNKYIKPIFTNDATSVGTTIYSLSPRGLVNDTAYTGWFVDKFTLAHVNEGKIIKRTRTAVDWDYEGYKKAAERLDPSFFNGYDGRPLDAWYLSHPITTDKEVFDKSKKGMSTQKFQSIFENPSLQRLIRQYEQEVFNPEINWGELAVSFNAILNSADDLAQGPQAATLEVNVVQPLVTRSNLVYDMVSMNDREFRAAMYSQGTRPVQTVGGGGCPPNKGIDLSGSMSGVRVPNTNILSNSVAKFGTQVTSRAEDDLNLCRCGGEKAHFHCPGKKDDKQCNNPIIVGKGISRCPKCGESKVC